MSRRHALVAVLATTSLGLGAFAGAAAAVGGEPLTKAAWIKKADRVCKSANRKLGPLVQEHFSEFDANERPSDEAVTAYAEDFVGIARKEVAKIRKLVPPEADEAQVEELLDAEEAAIDAVEEDPLLFLDGDPFSEVSQLALDYGLEVCGSG